MRVSKIGPCYKLFTTRLVLEFYLSRSGIFGIYVHFAVKLYVMTLTPRNNFHASMSI